MKFKFSPEDGWEKAIADAAEAAVAPYLGAAQEAVSDVWEAGFDYAQSLATQRLHTSTQKYLENLKKVKTQADTWTIILDADAVYLEEGFESYDMIQAGLVQGPKSRMTTPTAKDPIPRRYVRIPFDQVQAAASKGHPMNPILVQQGQMGQTTKGNLAADLKRLKKIFAPQDSGITMNPLPPGHEGPQQPVMGKVWSITKSPSGPQWEYKEFNTDMKKRLELEKQPNALLSGITKVQFQTDTGKMKAKYLTWRTATDPRNSSVNSKPKWIHPGFPGVHIMKDVEQYITDEFAKRINEIFSQGQ